MYDKASHEIWCNGYILQAVSVYVGLDSPITGLLIRFLKFVGFYASVTDMCGRSIVFGLSVRVFVRPGVRLVSTRP